MKTMNYQAPDTRTPRNADQRVEASVADEVAGPALQAPSPLPVIPWLIPVFGLLIVLTTGLIWATVL